MSFRLLFNRSAIDLMVNGMVQYAVVKLNNTNVAFYYMTKVNQNIIIQFSITWPVERISKAHKKKAATMSPRLRIGCNCELNICIFGIRWYRIEGACWENEGPYGRPNQASSRIFSYTAFRFQLEFTSFNIITVIICEADQIVEANGYLCAVVRLAFAFCDSRCQLNRTDTDSTARRWNAMRRDDSLGHVYIKIPYQLHCVHHLRIHFSSMITIGSFFGIWCSV